MWLHQTTEEICRRFFVKLLRVAAGAFQKCGIRMARQGALLLLALYLLHALLGLPGLAAADVLGAGIAAAWRGLARR